MIDTLSFDKISNILARVFLALFGGLALAQIVQAAAIPELDAPSTVSGVPTTARFYFGVTADDGTSYHESFGPDQVIDLKAEVRAESGHMSLAGNLFVLIHLDGVFFMRLADGGFAVWNGQLQQLQPAVANKTLSQVESVPIVNDVAFGPAGLAGLSFQVFIAYNLSSDPFQFYFNAVPASFAIENYAVPDPAQVALDFFTNSVANQIIGNQCMVCHVDGGLAQMQGSDLLYVPLAQTGATQTNFDRLRNYILNQPNGSQFILSKPQGQQHLGGIQLAPGSAAANIWAEFVDLVVGIDSGQGGQVAALQMTELLDNEQTLRKAALLFAGRLPSDGEYQQVLGASEEGLRATIRGLMSGDGFRSFLMEGANDRLLTLKYEGTAFQALDRYHYPKVDELINAGASMRNYRAQVSRAVAQEPLRLIAHVVMNERPYTEVLTANYIMVNPYSAYVYGGNVVFPDATNFNDWRESEITEYYRCTICSGPNPNASYNIPTVYPHAGLLNSPMFLARFPSTETNRNRARARWAYYFFLGVDIEGLAPRTTDPAALADENNPTLNNPNCTVCHNTMDPVAGTFQNYGDDGRYRNTPGGYDALPRSYKQSDLYHPGDRWYADMLAPGFGNAFAPGPDESLQWLGQQFSADPRFGYGAAYFWFPSVMGRQPLQEPENAEDPDYFSRLLAFTLEQTMLNSVAADFMAGSHGNGPFNLKDLLVDLVTSDHFRAVSADNLTVNQEVELDGVGVGRLLTPEALNRKLMDTTGYDWNYGASGALDEVYRLMYGGIDSDGITHRATELTTLMSTVVATMANEVSCSIVAQDFGRPAAQRFLFQSVELNSLPTTHPEAVRDAIQWLHLTLLGEDLPDNDPEILSTFDLFQTTWQERVALNKSPVVSTQSEFCSFANTTNAVNSDANQTLKSWAVVVNYLLRDYRFIYE